MNPLKKRYNKVNEGYMNKLDRIREVLAEKSLYRADTDEDILIAQGRRLERIKSILDEEDYARPDLPGDRCPNGHYCVVMGSDATPCINPACEYAHESVKKQKPSAKIYELAQKRDPKSTSMTDVAKTDYVVGGILDYLDEQVK